jgi:predicted ATP-dependent serine protease
MAFFGEVGLSGVARRQPVRATPARGAKLGFRRCVVPRSRQLKDSNRPEG